MDNLRYQQTKWCLSVCRLINATNCHAWQKTEALNYQFLAGPLVVRSCVVKTKRHESFIAIRVIHSPRGCARLSFPTVLAVASLVLLLVAWSATRPSGSCKQRGHMCFTKSTLNVYIQIYVNTYVCIYI